MRGKNCICTKFKCLWVFTSLNYYGENKFLDLHVTPLSSSPLLHFIFYDRMVISPILSHLFWLQVSRNSYILFCHRESICDRYWKVEDRQQDKVIGCRENIKVLFRCHQGLPFSKYRASWHANLSALFLIHDFFLQEGFSPGANLLTAVEVLVSGVVFFYLF